MLRRVAKSLPALALAASFSGCTTAQDTVCIMWEPKLVQIHRCEMIRGSDIQVCTTEWQWQEVCVIQQPKPKESVYESESS